MNHRIGPRAMTQAELWKFFQVIENIRDRLAFKLAYVYALRVSEIVYIKVEDIQWNKIIIQGLKNGRLMVYPVSMEIKDLLKKWLKVRPDRGIYLFPTEQNNGGHISVLTLQKRFYKYCDKAEIGYYSIHSLRHTRCVDLVSKDNVNPYEIAAFVRHKTITTILHYIREKQFDFGKFVE